MTTTSSPVTSNPVKRNFWHETFPKILNYLTVLLSLGLIVFISYYTYQGIDYLESNFYMTYQLIVCLVFIAEYIYRFITSKHKIQYAIFALPFLLIAIPYINIIEIFNINISHQTLAYFCFVPIVRGLVALIMVVNYIAETVSTTVFVSYAIVLIPIVYMSGLIFYVAEHGVNSSIKNFWYAIWWAGMNVTTIGCYINPVTSAGMIIGFILSLLGIIMLPLFTVYFGDVINRYNKVIKHGNNKQK